MVTLQHFFGLLMQLAEKFSQGENIAFSRLKGMICKIISPRKLYFDCVRVIIFPRKIFKRNGKMKLPLFLSLFNVDLQYLHFSSRVGTTPFLVEAPPFWVPPPPPLFLMQKIDACKL